MLDSEYEIPKMRVQMQQKKGSASIAEPFLYLRLWSLCGER
jgi:hypothetical protein